jgi:hypothetical protein
LVGSLHEDNVVNAGCEDNTDNAGCEDDVNKDTKDSGRDGGGLMSAAVEVEVVVVVVSSEIQTSAIWMSVMMMAEN